MAAPPPPPPPSFNYAPTAGAPQAATAGAVPLPPAPPAFAQGNAPAQQQFQTAGAPPPVQQTGGAPPPMQQPPHQAAVQQPPTQGVPPPMQQPPQQAVPPPMQQAPQAPPPAQQYSAHQAPPPPMQQAAHPPPPMQQPPTQGVPPPAQHPPQAPPPMQQPPHQAPPMQQAPPPMQQQPTHGAPPPVQPPTQGVAPPMHQTAPPMQHQPINQAPPMQQPPQQVPPTHAMQPPVQQPGRPPAQFQDPAHQGMNVRGDSFSNSNVASPNVANTSFSQHTPTRDRQAATPSGTPMRTVAQRARPKQGNSRIDSSQVPSPCRDLPVDDAGRNRPVYNTGKGMPPLSVTKFVAVDEGNANPKFIRPTIHSAPHDESFLRESGIPWGATLSPLYQPLDRSEVVPVVSGRAPVRCKRCRAYVNSWTQFTELGRRWSCQFCGMSNEVDAEYFSNLDNNGRRRDAEEKPELSRGSVEFDVDGIEEYLLRNADGQPVKTSPMHHLFLIDISKGAQGSLQDIVDSMQTTLSGMRERYPQCNVSFITYASTLQFYNFKSPNVPQLVVPDVENPFVPLPFTLMCWLNLEEDFDKITEFVDRIPSLSEATDEDGCCIGAAVKVASLVLASSGGKVVLTATKLPNVGVGAFKPREQHKLYGTDKEKELLKPVDGFWTSISVELAKRQISIDLLMFPQDYCELITLGQICHLTNGSQYLFLNYSAHDRLRVQVAFEKALMQEAGYGAILRVRCSDGIRVKTYNGHYLSTDPHDMDLAGIQGSSAFFVDMCHEGKLDPKGYAHMQCALLYTTRGGNRRVRLHTLRLTVSNAYAALFRNTDLEACTAAVAHHGIHDAVNKGPKAAREAMIQRTITLLVNYRKHCSQGSHTGQLLLPEQLKLLPLYTLALMKSDGLTAGTDTRIDERVQCIYDLLSMPIHRLLGYLYPKIYSVHNLLNHSTAGTFNQTTGLLHMPPLQQLTADIIMTHGVYIQHDQQARVVYLWLGSTVSARICEGLFGVEDIREVGNSVQLEHFNERLRNVIEGVMTHENGIDRLIIVHEKEAAEEGFFRNMVEDENKIQSYSDFLCYLHKQINLRLS